MRFFTHSMKPEWGLGVVAEEDGANLNLLFVGMGYKRIAKSFKGLVEVADEEVPGDHPARNLEGWPRIDRDGKRAEGKRNLPARFDGFVKEFMEAFPGGLQSEDCERDERTYKVDASARARRELSAEILDPLLAAGEYGEIMTRTHRCLASVNLAFPQELMKFRDIPESAHQVVAERIVRLVKAGAETPAALEDLAGALEPYGAAKWPIVSLLPFLLDPERWPFVKPKSAKLTAEAMGIDVEYSPRPNARTYELIRDLHVHVGKILGERGFKVRDLIDVQTFLWVASGMRRDLLKKREEDELE